MQVSLAILIVRFDHSRYWAWSGGVMVMGKLTVPINLDKSRARADTARNISQTD